ncbi:MerR family transcriptional regulator [Desulforamulus ruminis]|uniref:Regulatory protein MerR n=2 Tax=Desulforamulus ruminis TaxID=1564 RepID=F6DTI5_DESRL|nr:MerR family transcriptional regulator [Desulforamulus ruminis]AEG60047.1 regulatory protein MerR [Desulforamulus ruminis DSM 2154]
MAMLYTKSEVVVHGDMKLYKIGELAELAGVSKRTIDYYTNLSLLKPVRSESNYRYYHQDSLLRLKLIEGMKKQRFTLDEIKERMSVLDQSFLSGETGKNKPASIDVNFLKEQFKQLEIQLAQLQPVMSGMDAKQAALVTRQALMQSLAVIQSLLLYLNETAPFI